MNITKLGIIAGATFFIIIMGGATLLAVETSDGVMEVIEKLFRGLSPHN